MKKILLAVIIIMMLSIPAFADPMIQEGSKELGLAFSLRDGDYTLNIGFGTFIQDNLLVGGNFGYVNSDFIDVISIGGMIEHHFNLGTMTVPYLGASVAYTKTDYDAGRSSSSDDFFLFGPKVGVKQFITDYLAVDIHAQYLFSNESNYEEDLEILAGLRVFF